METFSFKKYSSRFDGTHYTLRKNWVESHLRCIGEDFWKITKNVYNVPQNGPTTTNEIKEDEFNIRAMEVLLSALSNSEMTNVIDLQTGHVKVANL